METFKDIMGFEGKYKISNLGRVLSMMNPKMHIILNPEITNRGYCRVHLKRKHYSVHRLVLLNFLGDAPTINHIVNHIDGNKLNNRLDNLEWATQSENIKHSFKLGMSKQKKGNNHEKHKTILKIDIESKSILEEIHGIKNYCYQKKYDYRSMTRALKKEYKTLYGFIWEYKTDETQISLIN